VPLADLRADGRDVHDRRPPLPPDHRPLDARRPGRSAAAGRRARGLAILDRHLAGRSFLVGDTYSIADIAVFAYSHVAEEAGLDTSAYPSFLAWRDRIRAQPGFVDDLEPYPPNARLLAGRSIYG
jgi:glutathione S-transferase